ncbi:hypothetical protein, partial [Streptomyces sp. PT12]|uniref:hypothetical protein n=1 Tax=Streptomyces sp. PT12 TaxID=1510197 RepID=UPI000E0297D2
TRTATPATHLITRSQTRSEDQAPVVVEPKPERKPKPHPARRGVLYEGWLATDGSLSVLHMETGKVIGWLTPDMQSFISAEV